jgi:hypothetical protein
MDKGLLLIFVAEILKVEIQAIEYADRHPEEFPS